MAEYKVRYNRGDWAVFPDTAEVEYDCKVDTEVWEVNCRNNDNKIINGEFVPNHLVDVDEIRENRDKLLKQSDWSVLPDAPLTTAKKAEWLAYRQALRDIPQQPGFPNFIIVPDEPAKE